MSNPILVIGAGVAGLTVAVELADSGIDTVLVERESSVGGNALNLYKAFPTDDCFYCFESNRSRPGIRKCFYRSALMDQPNIDLRINTEIEEITGEPGAFEIHLKQGAQYVDPAKCTMCGVCTKLSQAFSLLSPQCQPQSVTFDPEKQDEGALEAEEECPTGAIDLNAEPTESTLTVSDIVLATGYQEMKPNQIDEYGYGQYANVITQLELAEILDPNGPSHGALIRPSDGAQVRRLVMVQCVGSRDENYHPFCSKICCVFALKHANIIRLERNGTDVSVVYMDIRTYDRHERYYRKARDAGVKFIRGRVADVTPLEDETLDIVLYDSLLDKYFKTNADLLVLSSALEPSNGMKKMMEDLDLKSASGYVSPDNLLDNEVVAGEHVYACGGAIGPAEVPESVTQARAVASKILQERM